MKTPKKTLGFLLVAAVILHFQIARCASEADREIPVPKYTATQAVEMVSEYYQHFKGDPQRFVISVVYGRPDMMRSTLGNNFVQGDEKEWSWFVTYTHPRKGDSTTVYRLKDNGEIYALIHTQS